MSSIATRLATAPTLATLTLAALTLVAPAAASAQTSATDEAGFGVSGRIVGVAPALRFG